MDGISGAVLRKSTPNPSPSPVAKKPMTLQDQLAMAVKPRVNLSTNKDIFAKFEADKVSVIDRTELQLSCRDLGYTLTQAEVTFAITKMGGDPSGRVEVTEFKGWWARSDRWSELKLDEKELEVRRQASKGFTAWDSEQRGVIARKDFDRFHESLVQKRLATKDKASCLKELDKTGDGTVTFSEFAEWLSRSGTIKVKVT